MKQNIIKQMKEYRHKPKIVKAIPYEKGMEDGWMIIFPDISEDEGYIDRIFLSEDEAEKFIGTDDYKEYEYQYEMTKVVPVMLRTISDDLAECYTNLILIDGTTYEFEEITDDMWIVIDEDGERMLYEDFFDDYEEITNETCELTAEIGYDEELVEIYVIFNEKYITLGKSEVATVEKILDGLQIPFTERLGALLR